jgi:hypothetical protein
MKIKQGTSPRRGGPRNQKSSDVLWDFPFKILALLSLQVAWDMPTISIGASITLCPMVFPCPQLYPHL